MSDIEIREYRDIDRDAVIHLWKRCGLVVPWNDPESDIRRKLDAQPELFFVGLVEDTLIGTVMAGYEGHRGWINYLAVAPGAQKSGYGRALMEHAESRLLALGCPKINLQVRSSNSQALDFYRQLGYSIDDVVSMGKRLIQD